MAAIMRANNQHSSANSKAQKPDKRILEANAVQIERVGFMNEGTQFVMRCDEGA